MLFRSTRGSIFQDDVTRAPKCVSLHFDSSGFKFKIHPIKIQPSAEVFDLAGRERRVARTEAMDTFVDHLKDTLTFQAEGVPLEDSIKAVPDISDEIRERSIFYIEQAKRNR